MPRRAIHPGVAQANVPDPGQFDGQSQRVNTNIEAEDVQFNTFPDTRHKAEITIEGELVARTAGRFGKYSVCEIVFSDGNVGQRNIQFGYLPDYLGYKGVAVGAGPGFVFIREGVGVDSCPDIGAMPALERSASRQLWPD